METKLLHEVLLYQTTAADGRHKFSN